MPRVTAMRFWRKKMLLSEWRRLISSVVIWVGLSSECLLAQASTDDRIRRIAAYFVQHYSRIYGIEPELVESIVEVESDWRPASISPKGATGLMQLMPQTARRFHVQNRFNIEQNIRGGVEYLAWLHKVFKGDLRLVTAAYVAGENRVVRRGLAYSCPEVFAYVEQVARRYRDKLRSKQKEEGQS
jgi:soluble lytic murein transglycosylase-like protein